MIYDMAGRALQPLKVAYRVFVCTHACVAIQLLALAVALCTLNSIAALCCATLCAHRHKVMSFVVLCNMLRAPLACTCVQILGLFKNKGWHPQHRFLNMIYIYIFLQFFSDCKFLHENQGAKEHLQFVVLECANMLYLLHGDYTQQAASCSHMFFTSIFHHPVETRLKLHDSNDIGTLQV